MDIKLSCFLVCHCVLDLRGKVIFQGTPLKINYVFRNYGKKDAFFRMQLKNKSNIKFPVDVTVNTQDMILTGFYCLVFISYY